MTITARPSRNTTLKDELEQTRQRYHQLLHGIPDAAWEEPGGNPHWNIREIMIHITLAVQNLPLDIKMLRRRRMISPPAWLFDWFNIYYTRWQARGHSRMSAAAKYDAAHNRVIALLETIREDEWDLAGKYPYLNENLPGGEQSIAAMFHYLTLHLEEHIADIPPAYRPGESSARLLQSKEAPVSLSQNRRKPPTGLSRLLFRAPIHLFNNGLGWLLGRRFLLLEHTGRKSGKTRQAVVEIMGFDRAHNHFLIAAGFGPKSQWYRNILHDPQVHIQVGQRRRAATAVPLSPEAAGTALWEYVQKYPFITKGLSRMIGVTIQGEEAEIRAIAAEGVIPIVRLEPHGQGQLMSFMPGTAVLGALLSLFILLIYRGRKRE